MSFKMRTCIKRTTWWPSSAARTKASKAKCWRPGPGKSRVVVEGVNIQKRHMRPTRTNPQGGVVERPGPIAASNVMLVCPSCKKPARMRRRRTDKGVVGVHSALGGKTAT